MAKTPEGKVKDQVKEVLDRFGCYYFFPEHTGYGRSGVPDIIVCYRGRFIAIECKAGRGQTTALQKRELKNIDIAGGVALVVNEHNIVAVDSALQEVGNGT